MAEKRHPQTRKNPFPEVSLETKVSCALPSEHCVPMIGEMHTRQISENSRVFQRRMRNKAARNAQCKVEMHYVWFKKILN